LKRLAEMSPAKKQYYIKMFKISTNFFNPNHNININDRDNICINVKMVIG